MQCNTLNSPTVYSEESAVPISPSPVKIATYLLLATWIYSVLFFFFFDLMEFLFSLQIKSCGKRTVCQPNLVFSPLLISNDQQSVISQLVLCNHGVLPRDECSLFREENRAWKISIFWQPLLTGLILSRNVWLRYQCRRGVAMAQACTSALIRQDKHTRGLH